MLKKKLTGHCIAQLRQGSGQHLRPARSLRQEEKEKRLLLPLLLLALLLKHRQKGKAARHQEHHQDERCQPGPGPQHPLGRHDARPVQEPRRRESAQQLFPGV